MPNIRVVHFKKSKYDVFIGRPGKWGNPFTIGIDGNRTDVLKKYRNWLMDNPEIIRDAKKELTGKILGCWCSPKKCHGDILKEFVETDYILKE